MKITLDFNLHEDVTPEYFAQRVAEACSSGALRAGESVSLPPKYGLDVKFIVTDKPVDLTGLFK